MEPITRCGRTGNWAHPGTVFRDGERYCTVISSVRQNTYGVRGAPVCPRDDCWRLLTVHVRLATAQEIAAYCQEEREQRARWDAYQAKVMERRRAYLAGRKPAD